MQKKLKYSYKIIILLILPLKKLIFKLIYFIGNLLRKIEKYESKKHFKIKSLRYMVDIHQIAHYFQFKKLFY
jgi:hypothetical protein